MSTVFDTFLFAIGCFVGLCAAGTDYPVELVVAFIMFCVLGGERGKYFAKRVRQDGS